MTDSGFAEAVVPAAAVDAARALVGETSAAVWCIHGDGSLDVVRPGFRHELHRVHPDATTELLERSSRQWDAVLNGLGVVGGFVSLVGTAGTIATPLAPLFILAGVACVSAFVASFFVGQTAMQWARERAPADDWAYLPWEGTVAGASGNQLFAVAKVADGGVASVRVLGDGEIEVACDGTVHRVDGAGRTIARREHPRSSPWPARAVRVAAATAFAAAVPLEARPARAAVVLGVVLWLSTAFLDRGGDALPPDGGWTRIRTDEPGD